MRITTERVLEWFLNSPLAEQMEREALEAEELHNRRVRAYEQLHAAQEKKAEVPRLRAEIETAHAAYRAAYEKVMKPLAERAATLNRSLEDLERSIGIDQRDAELFLRNTARPVVRDGADVWHNLFQARLHVQTHSTVEAPQLRTQLRDLERTVGRGADAYQELAKRLEQIDAVEAVLPGFDAAVRKLEHVQLEVAPDLEALISEVTAGLPARCPVCNVKLRVAAGPPTEIIPTGTEGRAIAQREP